MTIRLMGTCVAIVLLGSGCGVGLIGMDANLLDCEGIPTCGQCTSNPGCGWCGDSCATATDGDVTQKPASCGETWTFKLGTCPVLPQAAPSGDNVAPATTPEEDEGMSPHEHESQLGDARYEALRSGLKWSFKNHLPQVHDGTVDGVLRAMDQVYPDEMAMVKDLDTEPFPDPPSDTDGKRYYVVEPIHTRVPHAEPREAFQQPVPMARYRLPDSGQDDICTGLGIAYAGDRKFNNLADFVNRTESSVGYAAAKVDVIAGIRWMGRFAPVTLYLAFKKADDAVPSFYVIESGLATGQSRTAYLSTHFTSGEPQVHAQGMYEPTPFASNAHWYNASLTMKGDDPVQLVIHSGRSPDVKQAYIAVIMNYEAQGTQTPENIVGYQYLLEATGRIAAIAEGLCIDAGFGIWQKPLAAIGRKSLHWDRLPNQKKPCIKYGHPAEESSDP